MLHLTQNLPGKRTDTGNSFLLPVFYISLYVLVCLLVNVCSGFQQTHNDFWDIFYGSRHLSFDNMRSLYSMHYPIGYYVFLKIIGIKGVSPEIPGIFGNVLFGAIMLITSVILYGKYLNQKISLSMVLLLSFFPGLFLYITNAGPDPASIAFFEIGAVIILLQIASNKAGSKRLFFIGGLALGCGALFRYHVFVGSLLFLLSLFLIYRNKWRMALISGTGLGLAFLPQLILFFITGPHTVPFAAINIYNLMYHIEWSQTSSIKFPPSFLWIIKQDPLLFLNNYFFSFLRHAPDYLPPLLAYFTLKEPLKKKLCLAILTWSVLYCVFFAAMESGRSQLLPIPLSFLCIGFFLEIFFDYFQKTTLTPKLIKVFTSGSVLVLLSLFLYKDANLTLRRIHENKETARIDLFLRNCGCTSAKELFTDDFYIYFRTMPPYRPYCNGGALRWGTNLNNEDYPEFPVASLEEFSAECKNKRVRFVLLTDHCDRLSPSLGKIYNGTSFEGIIFKTKIGKFKIFEIKAST